MPVVNSRAAEAVRYRKVARIVPEIGDPDARERFLRDYRIIFRVLEHGIRVLRVVNGARRLRRDATDD